VADSPPQGCSCSGTHIIVAGRVESVITRLPNLLCPMEESVAGHMDVNVVY
jgi:hypothetical protein